MEKIKIYQRIRLVLLILVSFLLISLSTLCGIILFSWAFSSEEKKNVGSEECTYRYLHLSKENNGSTTSGLLQLPEKMESSYMFYQDDNDDYVLISEFGSTEYQCFGSCYCEEEYNERRYMSTGKAKTFVKGMVYLVASLSSVVAYDLAKEYFQEECTKRITSQNDVQCLQGAVLSEVEGCEEVTKKRSRNFPPTKDTRKKYTKRKDVKVFECYGRCMDLEPTLNSHVANMRDFPSGLLDIFRMDFLKAKRRYNEEVGECRDLTMVQQVSWAKDPTLEWMRVSWIFRSLDEYCRESSSHNIISDLSVRHRQDMRDKNYKGDPYSMCCGMDSVYTDKIVNSPDFDPPTMTPGIMPFKRFTPIMWDSRTLNPSVECVLLEVEDEEEVDNNPNVHTGKRPWDQSRG